METTSQYSAAREREHVASRPGGQHNEGDTGLVGLEPVGPLGLVTLSLSDK